MGHPHAVYDLPTEERRDTLIYMRHRNNPEVRRITEPPLSLRELRRLLVDGGWAKSRE